MKVSSKWQKLDDHGRQWILIHVYTYVVSDENEVQGPIIQSSIKLIFG